MVTDRVDRELGAKSRVSRLPLDWSRSNCPTDQTSNKGLVEALFLETDEV